MYHFGKVALRPWEKKNKTSTQESRSSLQSSCPEVRFSHPGSSQSCTQHLHPSSFHTSVLPSPSYPIAIVCAAILCSYCLERKLALLSWMVRTIHALCLTHLSLSLSLLGLDLFKLVSWCWAWNLWKKKIKLQVLGCLWLTSTVISSDSSSRKVCML